MLQQFARLLSICPPYLILIALASCAPGSALDREVLEDEGKAEDTQGLCAHSSGHYKGPDAEPPSVLFPLGDEVLDIAEVIETAEPGDPRSALLAEYAVAFANIEAGVSVSAEDVDLLVLAEEALIGATVPRPELGDALRALNERWASQWPCLLEGNDGFSAEEPYINPVEEDGPFLGDDRRRPWTPHPRKTAE